MQEKKINVNPLILLVLAREIVDSKIQKVKKSGLNELYFAKETESGFLGEFCHADYGEHEKITSVFFTKEPSATPDLAIKKAKDAVSAMKQASI